MRSDFRFLTTKGQGMRKQRWELWALLEGLSKTVSAILQKYAGISIKTADLAMVYSIVLGLAHLLVGFVGNIKEIRRSGAQALVPDLPSIIWPIAFGFCASLSNVVGPVAFMYNADLTARTLLVLCSIIPGTLIGFAFFNEKYDALQLFGIGVFLFSAWAILDFPRGGIDGGIPVWVWITLIATFSNAINEGLAKKASTNLNLWANNFWIGISTIFWSTTGVIAYWLFAGRSSVEISRLFMFAALGTGVVVIFMITFKLLAYRDDAWIALKKMVMNGTYLISATVIGLLLFNETFTIGKGVGIACFILALLLSDQKARSFIAKRVLKMEKGA